MTKTTFAFGTALAVVTGLAGTGQAAPFRVFMISSTASDHLAMSAAARVALPQMGMVNDFTIDATTDNTLINDVNLAKYDVFLQMHLAPFEIKVEQRAALETFVKSGKGWVGVHGAGLIIPSAYVGRSLPDWPFFNDLIGGVTWVTHPALQNGTVIMEDRTHPATKNMPAMFQIRDEWYEFSGNPRSKVRVLGKADESTYNQVKRMGDHPLIWACEKYPRAIYTATGHDASDWQNAAFNILIRDSLLWAAGRLGAAPDGGADDAASDVASDAASDVAADAPAAVDSGSGGMPGSGGATVPMVDAGSGGAGGSAVGSGGAVGQASGGASGSGATPGISDGGCSCHFAREGETRKGVGSALLFLIGLGFIARRRRRPSQSALTRK